MSTEIQFVVMVLVRAVALIREGNSPAALVLLEELIETLRSTVQQ
jgi:hypothetical protein